jgi:hypothetical protein
MGKARKTRRSREKRSGNITLKGKFGRMKGNASVLLYDPDAHLLSYTP